MRVAVLGAFGLMAEPALHDLAENPLVSEIMAVDIHLERAKAVLSSIPRRRKIRALRADLTDTRAAASRIGKADLVLNCAWYEHNMKAMDLSLALKAHYVDLGGLFHMTLRQLKRDSQFKKAGLNACLGCGSTPGITNMMVSRLADDFDLIDTVGIYDAGHDPDLEAPSSQGFVPPFSIRTMLPEYEQAAPVLLDGRLRDVAANSLRETLDFKPPIGRVEAGAVVHSEAATLPGFLRARGHGVRNLYFKIAYPKSVQAQLEMLSAMGFSRKEPVPLNGKSLSPLDFLTAMALKGAREMAAGPASSRPAPRDFEILRVRVQGLRNGRARSVTWDCELRPSRGLSAGAMGVGYAGAIAASLILKRHTLLSGGVAAPESLLEPQAFFRELGERKAFSLIEKAEEALPLA